MCISLVVCVGAKFVWLYSAMMGMFFARRVCLCVNFQFVQCCFLYVHAVWNFEALYHGGAHDGPVELDNFVRVGNISWFLSAVRSFEFETQVQRLWGFCWFLVFCCWVCRWCTWVLVVHVCISCIENWCSRDIKIVFFRMLVVSCVRCSCEHGLFLRMRCLQM